MSEYQKYNPEANEDFFTENWHMDEQKLNQFVQDVENEKYSLSELDKIEEQLDAILEPLLAGDPKDFSTDTEPERRNLNKALDAIFIYKNDRTTDTIEHFDSIN